MSSLSVPYALGGTLTEQQRLIAQAQGLEPHARWMLDRVTIKPGFRAVDVGCGPIGIMNLLSERVGPDGDVVGVEREPRFVDMARTELSKRGLRNVRVVSADALKTGLEKSSYDIVHERLVLINVPTASQEALLAEMLSLLKPGGTIAFKSLIRRLMFVTQSIYLGTFCWAFGMTRSTLLVVTSLLAARWPGCCGLQGRKTYR